MSAYKTFIASLLVAASLSGCDRTGSDVAPDDAGVPQSVVSGLRQSFPQAEAIRFSVVEKQQVWAADFQQRARAFEAKLNTAGQVLEAFRLGQAGEELPDAVRTYITNTYRGFTLVKWSLSTDAPVFYRIVLEQTTTRLTVDVDPQGRLINRYTQTNPTQPVTVYQLTLSDLPQPVQTYLQGYTFRQVTIILADGKRTYAVSAQKGSDIYLLLFDEAGTLVKSEIVRTATATDQTVVSLRQADLPASITTFLNAQYPGWTFRDARVTLLSAAKPVAYDVVFLSAGKAMTATFDGTGALLRVRTL